MHSHPITDAQHALQFALAGNATITLKSRSSQARYTYRIRQAQDNDALFFVSLMDGPDNESSYHYMGVIRGGEFTLTRKSKMTTDSTPVKAFTWALSHLSGRHEVPAQLEIWHEGRCGRCGRKLTVPESIERGIGPECAERMGIA